MRAPRSPVQSSLRKLRLVFRADISPTIGSGHFMRCLALAQACQDQGGEAAFIFGGRCPSSARKLLKANCILHKELSVAAGSLLDAYKTADLAYNAGAHYIIIDGYHFGAPFQKAIKARGLRMVAFDDFGHTRRYWADFILNPGLRNPPKPSHHHKPYIRFLGGNHYALLRREFLELHRKKKVRRKARNILVLFGGSDEHNVTTRVIRAVSKIKSSGLKVKVVVGPLNPHWKKIQSAVKDSFRLQPQTHLQIQLLRNPDNLPQLMTWADVAISAAGCSLGELSYVGLPSLTLIVARNQQAGAEIMSMAGMNYCLGWYDEVSDEEIISALSALLINYPRRRFMLESGQKKIDGLGAARVLKVLGEASLKLRPACKADSESVWRLATLPGVRRVAFSRKKIPWNEHAAWFQKKLKDPKCFFWIAEKHKQKPVGYIRYERRNRGMLLSLAVEPPYRGRGYANDIIRHSLSNLFRSRDIRKVDAYVVAENKISSHVFKKNGFYSKGLSRQKGRSAFHFVYERVRDNLF